MNIFKSFNYYCRLFYLIYILIRFRTNIAKAFETLGPAYIKLGQFLSTRADLVGEKIAADLAYLRDSLPSFSFIKVRRIIEAEFNQPLESLFKSFEEEAIAAASISQVHKAKTHQGELVAVKILRPNIEKHFAQEIAFFYFVAARIEKLFPKYKRLKLTEVVDTLATSFRFELDLTLEAAAASELSEKNELDFVLIPQVNWSLTSKNVLTTQWMEGISIYNQDKLKEMNIDLTLLAKNFAIMFFRQAFSSGFFHADLHQGNILVNPKGQIILLDFGIMGRLDYHNRIYVAQILHGFLNRDYDLIAKIHIKAGYVDSKYSAESFAQSCRAIGEPIMHLNPKQISIARLLAQLFNITEIYQMETQPQLLLLQKTMIMVEGIGKSLCDDSNLWQLAESSIKQWAAENFSIEARFSRIAKILAKKIIDRLEKASID